MEALKKTLSFFIPEDVIDANRRRYTRMSGAGMTVTVGETYYDVENWSEGGLLLKAENANIPSTKYTDLDITLRFCGEAGMASLKHKGRVIRQANGRIAIALNPFDESDKVMFGRLVDSVLTESFIASQLN
ncbi:MAG: hypothetical protein EP349_08535 [Alphaproteobacteria bacterium]|nr:MAG: hypothetical protein EP349_08535 [Alphaproteobacteria bacterium]